MRARTGLHAPGRVKPRIVTLARHGAAGTPTTPSDVGTGWTMSAPLAEAGIEQARSLRALLASTPYRIIGSSGVLRAEQTLNRIYPERSEEARVYTELGHDDEREAWEELVIPFLRAEDPLPLERLWELPFVATRIRRAYERVLAIAAELAGGEHALLVTHHPILPGIVASAQGAWPPLTLFDTGQAIDLAFNADGEFLFSRRLN